MKRFLFGFCLVVMAACGERDGVPSDVIPHDKMTTILIDIYTTEAQVNNYMPRLPRDSAFAVFDTLKADLFEKHEISDSVFHESMQWYFENPIHLDALYERVIDSLNLKLQQNREPGEQVE